MKASIKLPKKRTMITCKGKETRILILKNRDTGRAVWISNSIKKHTERKIKGPNKYDNI